MPPKNFHKEWRVNEGNIHSPSLVGGTVNIELYAERKILGRNRIRVKFKETVIMLFENEAKRGKAKGTGV